MYTVYNTENYSINYTMLFSKRLFVIQFCNKTSKVKWKSISRSFIWHIYLTILRLPDCFRKLSFSIFGKKKKKAT